MKSISTQLRELEVSLKDKDLILKAADLIEKLEKSLKDKNEQQQDCSGCWHLKLSTEQENKRWQKENIG